MYRSKSPHLDRSRHHKPRCDKCGRRVVFMKAYEPAEGGGYMPGKVVPCDVRWQYGDGRTTLITQDGMVIDEAPRSVLGRVRHRDTCRPPRPPATASKEDRLAWILAVTKSNPG